MKVSLYHTAFAIISAISYGDANSTIRGLHRGGGDIDGHRGSWKQGIPFAKTTIEEECEAFNCQAIATENLDCNIEKPEIERPDLSEMTYEETQEACGMIAATKHEHRRQILRCACCTEATLDDLLPTRSDGDSFLRLGDVFTSSKDGADSMASEDIELLTSEDGEEDTSSAEEETSVGEEESIISVAVARTVDGSGFGKKHGMRKFGCAGDGLGKKVKYLLNNHCPDFQCPDSLGTECTRLDSTATKEERKENVLNCVCCQDEGVSALQDSNEEEDVSVLLASVLSSESDVQTKESYLGSPASAKSLTLALILTGAGAVLAMA